MNLIKKYNDERPESKLTPSQLADRKALLRAIMRREDLILHRGRGSGKTLLLESIVKDMDLLMVSANERMRRMSAERIGKEKTISVESLMRHGGYRPDILVCDDLGYYENKIPKYGRHTTVGFY